tara:strand:+ start:744 stop:1082 length:339 start_codon:yes stop_codon:yes gene_type:complete
MGTTGRNGIMAIAGVVCSVRCPAGDCETICREGAVTLPISWSPGIWLSSSGSIGLSIARQAIASNLPKGANIAAGNLNSSNFQRLLIDPPPGTSRCDALPGNGGGSCAKPVV